MTIHYCNNFHNGLKIMLDGEPYSIESSEFVKPGKGRSFARVKLRRLLNGSYLEKTFKSTDYAESADVVDVNLVYLYSDSNFWYFMNSKTFEQLSASSEVIGNNAKWLLNQTECIVTLWNNDPIIVIPPKFVKLKVMKTDPCLKGDTTGNCSKFATMSTGAVIKVPIFIQVGELIKIDTRSGQYVSRVK